MSYDARVKSTSDRTVDTATGNAPNKLRQQAGELLLQPDASRQIQMARFGTGTANVNQDQVTQALDRNASTELFDKLVAQDKRAAAEYAVAHVEMQTHALHGVDDEAFQQDVRLRLTGQAGADT